jgi:hypothetical protein
MIYLHCFFLIFKLLTSSNLRVCYQEKDSKSLTFDSLVFKADFSKTIIFFMMQIMHNPWEIQNLALSLENL